MECPSCGYDNVPGELLCEQCSAVMPGTQSVPAAPVVKVASASQPASASSAASGLQVCCFVESGKVTDREFELPEDDFEFLLGRSDLDEGIIPDVDLTKFDGKVTIAGETGYTYSRKQAIVSRRFGTLYLKALGSAKTMHRASNTTDWELLKQGEEVELSVGDRMRFGGSQGALVFEVAQK